MYLHEQEGHEDFILKNSIIIDKKRIASQLNEVKCMKKLCCKYFKLKSLFLSKSLSASQTPPLIKSTGEFIQHRLLGPTLWVVDSLDLVFAEEFSFLRSSQDICCSWSWIHA